MLICELCFSDCWGHSKLTTSQCWLQTLLCVAFIAQINRYGKFKALHQLTLIFLQLTNQINQKFPEKSYVPALSFKNCSEDKVL